MLFDLYSSFRTEMGSGTILGYFLQALPVACIVGVVFFVFRFALLKKKKRPIHWKQEILQVIFACYLTGLISLIVLPANFWLYFYDGVFYGWWEEMGPIFQFGSVNLVPTVVKCWMGEFTIGSWVQTMLMGNVAMFVPFGFFLPFVTKIKGKGKMALFSALIPVCFEAAQVFFGRSFDVDDILCNFIGMMLGGMIAALIGKARSTHQKAEKNPI